MRSTWQLPQERSLPLQKWTVQEVLLEFNGPQLAILACDNTLYLSVASDADESRVRWLRVPISETERNALLIGATTVRDCVLKDEIVVVDTDHSGNSLAEVVVTPDALHEDDLPSTRSLLPDEIIEPHKKIIENPSFILNGPTIVEHSVSFRMLADVSQQIQRLWNAIGQTVVGTATTKGSVPAHVLNATELRLTSLQPGSVDLRVDVKDEQLFGEIAATYSELLLASGAPESLQGMLQALKARVRSAFSDFLSVVQRHNVEVLTRWQDKAAFVSPSTATRIASSLEYVGRVKEEQFSAIGHFIGFHRPASA